MREIIFRGQTRKKGERCRINGEPLPGNWVYGGICPGKGDYSIIYGGPNIDDIGTKNVVYSETVGQFTGLLDKNGKRIFEGDIIKTLDPVDYYTVKYQEDGFIADGFAGAISIPLCDAGTCGIFVVGNIHDDSELLEVSYRDS